MDIADRASQVETEQRERALQARVRPNATHILNCLKCGESIPSKRKKALPHAIYCIDCQRIAEQRGEL